MCLLTFDVAEGIGMLRNTVEDEAPGVTPTLGNGPAPEATPIVLAVPRRRDIRATLLLIGARLAAPARQALAGRAHAEDHWIGNHGFTHAGRLADSGARFRQDVPDHRVPMRRWNASAMPGGHVASPAALPPNVH